MKSLALLAAAGCLLAFPVSHGQTIQVNKDNRTIAVTATDNATADADIATVQIGFVAYGADRQSAYAEGSRVSNAVTKALMDTGVKKDAIESADQSIMPVQQYEAKNVPADAHFRVTQSWSVKSNADDAAKVLDTAVKAGANQSGQINWSLKDENALDAKAAGKALARAQAIAQQMAGGLHIKLGALIYASNQAASSGIPPIRMMSSLAASPQAQQIQPLAIYARTVEKAATVYAVFAIE